MSAGRSLELYVRSLSPAEPRTAEFARRVRGLERAGGVAESAVTVWGDEVGLSTTAFRTPAGKCVLDRVAEFRAWADETGVEILPFFESRTVASSVTGETYAALRLPTCCLAESVDDEIVHVAPHREGDMTVRVADRLRDLEGATTDGRTAGAGAKAIDH